MSKRPPLKLHLKPTKPQPYFIYGRHSVIAALENHDRRSKTLYYLEPLADEVATVLDSHDNPPPLAALSRQALEKKLGNVPHQGIALEVHPLGRGDLQSLLHDPQPSQVFIALDQVTDPQNVGSILRTATAFKAKAVIATQRHGAGESGALARAACGGLDLTPYIQVVNLSETLVKLKEHGFTIVGMGSEGAIAIKGALPKKCVLVMGAEGKGLRQKTRETCDLLCALPVTGAIHDLNVSVATAISLYEWRENHTW